jgi:hypothetical protein
VKVALLALALAGCLDRVAPDVGSIAHAPCSNDDSDPGRAVGFETDIRAEIFQGGEYHCVHCHTPTGTTPLGVEVGGLDLSTYATLIAGARGNPVVVAGQPCASLLVQKLGDAPPFGGRMPLDGPPFLEDEDLQVVADWIAEGAHDE